MGSTGSKNPPDSAARRESDLPGALSSPSNPRESEEFWADLGRVPDAYPPISGALFGLQKGCKRRLLPPMGLIVALALP